MRDNQVHHHGGGQPHHYRTLALMTVLAFVAMYILMYAMVDSFANVTSSVNQLYMAGLMTSPMVLLELVFMRHMYSDKRTNVIVTAVAGLAFVACWVFIRQQVFVGDTQLLRSMIPHHAGAVLMCEKAKLEDPEVSQLCAEIVRSQRSEISKMKAMLSGS
jgi:hypothetical protein